MKPKQKISQRELWLVSLLPAALVIIVSLAIPGPADKIAETERRLEQLSGGDAHESFHKQLRQHTTQLKASEQELAELEARETIAQSRLHALQSPGRSGTLEMAEALDKLTHGLARHGVRVLAMEKTRSNRTTPAKSSTARSSDQQSDWQISVAATWPAVRQALADANTFPPGLALSAMKMDPPRPNVALRKWELIVTDAGATP